MQYPGQRSPREVLNSFNEKEYAAMLDRVDMLRCTLDFQLLRLRCRRTDYGKSFNGAHKTFEYDEMTRQIGALELLISSLI